MTVTSGFFNSVKGDRKYNSDQMSECFEGIILDGVLHSVGDALRVTPYSGTQVHVGTGKAWFNNRWVKNDSILVLTLSSSNATYDRIDAVVVEINMNKSARTGDIKVVSGVASANPSKPNLINTKMVHQHPLAYITRKAGSLVIEAKDIESRIGMSDCPYVTGPLTVLDIEMFTAQMNDRFNEWFNDLNVILSGDVAANLAIRIKALEDILLESETPTSEVTVDDNKAEVVLDQSNGKIKGKI